MKPAGAAIAVAFAATVAAGCVSRPDRMPDQRCAWPDPVVVADAPAVQVHKFADIDTNWTLARVFARLGPARREVDAHTYEWVADDGRLFVAAAASRCGILRKADFVR